MLAITVITHHDGEMKGTSEAQIFTNWNFFLLHIPNAPLIFCALGSQSLEKDDSGKNRNSEHLLASWSSRWAIYQTVDALQVGEKKDPPSNCGSTTLPHHSAAQCG